MNKKQDMAATTTRNTSSNLNTGDIEGKSYHSLSLSLTYSDNKLGAIPKLHGSKQVKKPEFGIWDIDRSGPRALHISLFKKETNLLTEDL